MLGIAQKLFNAVTENRVPFKACKSALHWKYLEHFFTHYELSPIDLQVAKTLLKNYTMDFESVAALICHLSNAVRNGHLMIKVENGGIFPSIKSIWTKESEISDEDLNKIHTLCIAGFQELETNPLFKGLISKQQKGFITTSLYQFENMLYFQRYFNSETAVLENLSRLQKSEPSLKCDNERITASIKTLLDNKTLLKEQAEAILKASTRSITLICGGPGTGKTYTAGYLLKILTESWPEEVRLNLKIALAAPTGKAASNLQKSLSHLIASHCKAKTLHQLLRIRSDGKIINDNPLTLNADIILIDESSMIDVTMMAKLLSSVKTGTRIIFLGDQHQLPSIDAGAMFSDIANLIPEAKATLQVCLRAELQEIVDFGKAINEGNSGSVFRILQNGNAVKKIAIDPNLEENLFQHFKNRFPLILKDESNPVEILKSFDQFKMLSPLRSGSFGVDSLNRIFFQGLVKKSNHSIAIPIMLLRNDSQLELYNGEVGVLVLAPRGYDETFNAKKGDYALFPCKINGFRKLPALTLPQYEYAYCLSVHKSQGSEFNHVLCLLPQGSEHFGREVLYTAVTRARLSLMILGNDAVIDSTIKNKAHRLSGLERRNQNEIENSSTTC